MPRPLIILLHAWLGDPAGLTDVSGTLRQSYPEADFVTPAYPAQWYSLARPAHLAAGLADQIARHHRPMEHSETLLIGHSLGGLLLAKAYCYAAGAAADLPRIYSGRKSGWHAWAQSVSRIVCFAGLLRGWSLPWVGRQLSPARWLALRAAAAIAPPILAPTGVARLILSARHSSPFVTRLAQQWSVLARTGQPIPTITQLHGTRDQLLSPADIRGPAGQTIPPVRYIPVEGAAHEDIVNFTQDARRRESFMEALQPQSRRT